MFWTLYEAKTDKMILWFKGSWDFHLSSATFKITVKRVKRGRWCKITGWRHQSWAFSQVPGIYFQARSRGACLCPSVWKPVALTHEYTGSHCWDAGSCSAKPGNCWSQSTCWLCLSDPGNSHQDFLQKLEMCRCSQVSSISWLVMCHWDPTSAPLCWCWWASAQEIRTNSKSSDCWLCSHCICLDLQGDYSRNSSISLSSISIL